jgi:hypothetical protein
MCTASDTHDGDCFRKVDATHTRVFVSQTIQISKKFIFGVFKSRVFIEFSVP